MRISHRLSWLLSLSRSVSSSSVRRPRRRRIICGSRWETPGTSPGKTPVTSPSSGLHQTHTHVRQRLLSVFDIMFLCVWWSTKWPEDDEDIPTFTPVFDDGWEPPAIRNPEPSNRNPEPSIRNPEPTNRNPVPTNTNTSSREPPRQSMTRQMVQTNTEHLITWEVFHLNALIVCCFCFFV